MPGNSQRGGARRKPGSKKGAVVGSGGQRRRALEGKGPTPPAELRPGHPAQRRAVAAKRTAARGKSTVDTAELLVGRNPVLEALRAEVPATALYVALGIEVDERVAEVVRLAGDRGIAILEVSRPELDRRTGGILHQGLALQVPPFRYADPLDLLAATEEAADPALFVALAGVTDPRNLGAVVRSAAAFGGHGVLLPERRSAGMTAVAWRASAGTAARLPVARATNLVRTLTQYQKAGLSVVGLAADGAVALDDLDVALDPLVIVVGSEGRGLPRLVGETCDLTVSIPMAGAAESLNASVAAAVALAEVARRRRQAGRRAS
jgi:23S rRNA (guanosine2251-2'-O)-methyltransferase